MKKVVLFITLLIGSVSFGQTIMVNDTPMYVSDDISFPFWMESGSSIDIGEGVASISIVEFELIPNGNTYDLEFVKTKFITNLETTPEGKAWKVESILMHSSDSYNSSTSSDPMPVSLSEGIHSPDTLSYWRVDAINLKNDPASYTILSNLNRCYSDNGYTKCSYFLSTSSVNILRLGDINFSVSPNGEGFSTYASDGCESCSSTYDRGNSFTSSVFNNLNFPIYITNTESIVVSSPDIILSILEFKIK